jgi:Helix-turn-helix domain of resolvase
MKFPVNSLLAGNSAFRDGFARDCLLQRRVICELDFLDLPGSVVNRPGVGRCTLSASGCSVWRKTGEGRERAKARGVKMGRKPKLTPHQQAEAIKRREAGEPIREIARSYNVHNSTISRLSEGTPTS